MDAKSFGDFLSEKLTESAKVFESHLLNSAYEKVEQFHRAAGTRDVLVNLATNMEGLLTDFQKKVDGSNGDSQ